MLGPPGPPRPGHHLPLSHPAALPPSPTNTVPLVTLPSPPPARRRALWAVTASSRVDRCSPATRGVLGRPVRRGTRARLVPAAPGPELQTATQPFRAGVRQSPTLSPVPVTARASPADGHGAPTKVVVPMFLPASRSPYLLTCSTMCETNNCAFCVTGFEVVLFALIKTCLAPNQ